MRRRDFRPCAAVLCLDIRSLRGAESPPGAGCRGLSKYEGEVNSEKENFCLVLAMVMVMGLSAAAAFPFDVCGKVLTQFSLALSKGMV